MSAEGPFLLEARSVPQVYAGGIVALRDVTLDSPGVLRLTTDKALRRCEGRMVATGEAEVRG